MVREVEGEHERQADDGARDVQRQLQDREEDPPPRDRVANERVGGREADREVDREGEPGDPDAPEEVLPEVAERVVEVLEAAAPAEFGERVEQQGRERQHEHEQAEPDVRVAEDRGHPARRDARGADRGRRGARGRRPAVDAGRHSASAPRE